MTELAEKCFDQAERFVSSFREKRVRMVNDNNNAMGRVSLRESNEIVPKGHPWSNTIRASIGRMLQL